MYDVYDSMSAPRMVAMSPYTGRSPGGVASPYPAPRPGAFLSPGEVIVTASGRRTPGSATRPTPNLLKTAGDVRGTVDIMVYRIVGFTDTADMMGGKTDPYVRITYERQKQQTKVKQNAGGTVEFNETLSISKTKDRSMIKVSVCDSDYMSDDVLAEKEIDLSKLPIDNWSEFIEQAKPVPFDLEDRAGKYAGTVFLGFASCTVLVKVYHIENFVSQSGFMDKTDPYVKITYGGMAYKTKTVSNAGGNANFDEILELGRNRQSDLLKVQVFDADTTSDDCLGEREIDLTKQYFSEALDGSTWVHAIMLDLVKDGRLQGSVKLAFCKVPFVNPAGNSEQMLSPAPKVKTSFVGQLHVKVFKIEGFADSAGMMDKTDPYVRVTMGKSTKKTSVKSNAGGTAEFDEILTFAKGKDDISMTISVCDSDTLSRDDVLGTREIDLTRQVYAEDMETIKRGMPFDFMSEGAVIGRVYLAFAACIIHCHIHSIEGFAKTSGFMDKTDPYVRIQLGTMTKKTKVKNNAGGAAEFRETLSVDKPAGVNMLKVSVFDSDTTSDDVLGERDIDLRMQYYWPSADEGQATAVEVYRQGKIAGTVFISFAKSPKRPGSKGKSPQRASVNQTKWVPERVQKQVAGPVVYRRKDPCEDICDCCCCCCPAPTQSQTTPTAATYPQGFREVGYRVDLDGQWERRQLAGDETHVLSVKDGDDLPLKARIEVPVKYEVSVPGPTQVVTDYFVEREIQATVMTPVTIGMKNTVVPGPLQAVALPAPPQYVSSPLPTQYTMTGTPMADYGASPLQNARGPPALINSMANPPQGVQSPYLRN